MTSIKPGKTSLTPGISLNSSAKAGIDLAVEIARIARPLDDQFDLPIVIQIEERPLKAVCDSDERHNRRHGNAKAGDGQQSPRGAAKQVTPGDCREAHCWRIEKQRGGIGTVQL